MSWDFPSLPVFFVGSGLALLCFVFAFGRRRTPGAQPFMFLMLAIAEWVLARGFEAGGGDLAERIFWAKVEYLGIVSVGPLWLCFALDYAGYDWWRRPHFQALLWLIPLVTLVMVWTNELHGLIWPTIAVTPGISGPIFTWHHGPWFWVHAAYEYATVVAGAVILMRLAWIKPALFRRQVVAVLIGSIVVIAASLTYLLGFSKTVELDLAPLIFVTGGAFFMVAITFAISSLRLLDVIPVARGTLIERMPEGILVLNADSCIVDMNPAAARIMGVEPSFALGQPVEKVWEPWKDQIQSALVDSGGIELFLSSAEPIRYTDVRVIPIAVRRGVS